MSYIRKSLMPNETIAFHAKPHWIIFFPIFIWIIISGALVWFGPRWGLSSINFFGKNLTEILVLLALLVAIYHFLRSYIAYSSAEYAITNKRVLMKSGLLRRNSLEIFLSKIESIHVSQGILGRLLDFGSITVSGTGGSKDPFSYIPQPMQFRKLVQEQVEKA